MGNRWWAVLGADAVAAAWDVSLRPGTFASVGLGVDNAR